MTKTTSVSVTRAHLVEAACLRTGMSKVDVNIITERMFEVIGQTLMASESVKLTNFGTLEVRGRAQRFGRNPRTGTHHPISSREIVYFVPGARIRSQIAHLENSAKRHEIENSVLLTKSSLLTKFQ